MPCKMQRYARMILVQRIQFKWCDDVKEENDWQPIHFPLRRDYKRKLFIGI